MRFLFIVTLGFFLIQTSFADTPAHVLMYDSVSIGFIPAKGAVHKGEPYMVLGAKVLSHHRNKRIEEFHVALNKHASEGGSDNATQFHQPTVYIETVFQGKQVRLFFSGDSRQEKFSSYEKQWKLLHGEIFNYLNANISPDGLIKLDTAKDTAKLN